MIKLNSKCNRSRKYRRMSEAEKDYYLADSGNSYLISSHKNCVDVLKEVLAATNTFFNIELRMNSPVPVIFHQYCGLADVKKLKQELLLLIKPEEENNKEVYIALRSQIDYASIVKPFNLAVKEFKRIKREIKKNKVDITMILTDECLFDAFERCLCLFFVDYVILKKSDRSLLDILQMYLLQIVTKRCLLTCRKANNRKRYYEEMDRILNQFNIDNHYLPWNFKSELRMVMSKDDFFFCWRRNFQLIFNYYKYNSAVFREFRKVKRKYSTIKLSIMCKKIVNVKKKRRVIKEFPEEDKLNGLLSHIILKFNESGTRIIITNSDIYGLYIVSCFFKLKSAEYIHTKRKIFFINLYQNDIDNRTVSMNSSFNVYNNVRLRQGIN